MVQLFKYCGLVAGIVGYFIYVLWGMVFPEAQSACKGININIYIYIPESKIGLASFVLTVFNNYSSSPNKL